MKNNVKKLIASLSLCFTTIAVAPTVFAVEKPTEIKIGFVTFLSGGAAGPFGIPARNAAEVIIEGINTGTLPEPYASKGVGGSNISPIFIDENSKQKVADYKRLIQKDKVDVIIGYASSGSCKAIAPIAEEEKTLTIFSICGTPQIFEDIVTNPQYLYRTSGHATMDNVAAARYIVDTNQELASIAGINQNYAWGQDSWRDFSLSIKNLKKDITVVTEQFPKIFAGQYGSEISAVLTKRPSVVHSSFWGGDLEALIIQGGGRGMFARSQVVLTSSDTAIQRLGPKIPNGTVIGARGFNGEFAKESELNSWFRKAYFDRFGSYPDSPSYQMAQSIIAIKAAADKAGSSKPDLIRNSLRGLNFVAPSGDISMSLSGGHQAITGTAYGTYQYDKAAGKGKFINVREYDAACINPPEGIKSIDWIKSAFKGAKCQ